MSATDPTTLFLPDLTPSLASTTVADGTASNGSEIDLSTGDYLVVFLILGNMNGSLEVELESSATSGSAYADASPEIIFTIPDGKDGQQAMLVVNVKESTQLQRYGRLTFTGGGGTVVVAASHAMFSLGDSRDAKTTAGAFTNANVYVYTGNPGA